MPYLSSINDRKEDAAGVSEDEGDSSDEEFTILDERDPQCKVLYTHPEFQSIFQYTPKNSEIFVKNENRNDVTEMIINDQFGNIKETAELKEKNMQSSGIDIAKDVPMDKLVENIYETVERKDKERSLENLNAVEQSHNIIIPGNENLTRGIITSVGFKDNEDKNKSSFSAKKIIQRMLIWALDSYFNPSSFQPF